MKKEIKKNKLSLTKLNITKLTNSHMIRGGNETNGTDTGDKGKAEYELKCINNSEQHIWVEKEKI